MLDLMLPPIVAGLVILAIHSYLGLHVLARGVIFVDLAFAQIAALGTTLSRPPRRFAAATSVLATSLRSSPRVMIN
jgi:hypothetical protein